MIAKMKQFSWIGSLDLMKLFYIHLSKGGNLKQSWNKLRLADWQHSCFIMEHYLVVLNTVIHSFPPAILWEIALTFKGMMIHTKAGHCDIMSLRLNVLTS